MVKNINKLKGKITESGYNMKTLSKEINLCETTLRRKINYDDAEFTIKESIDLKEILKLDTRDYVDIFFGNTLEFNSKIK